MERSQDTVAAALKRTSETIGKVAEQADVIAAMGERIAGSLRNGGKVLIFGNGGSAADSQHFACELAGRFLRDRAPLAAVALSTNTSSLSAIANDYGYDDIFVRQLEPLAKPGDVAIAISTSGDSPNVLKAVETAKRKGMTVLGLAGETGGKLKPLCDLCLCVPARLSPCIQEGHITAIHILCDLIEETLFPDAPKAH